MRSLKKTQAGEEPKATITAVTRLLETARFPQEKPHSKGLSVEKS